MSRAFAQLLDNIQQSDPLVVRHANFDTVAIRREISERIENTKLQVMLYGAYNAGKSTLINALLGREAAIVNDIPTTDRIDSYDWDGIHLLDTPGVNAPIQHEKVTEEQLKRTGALIFIIREGDLDAKDVYLRLMDVLKRGKKVFIIFNNQLTTLEDRVHSIQHINRIIGELAEKSGLPLEKIAEITVLPMNLRTAYNGRIKHHEKLLEHSGYYDFMERFQQWLVTQRQEIERFESLKHQIDECWYTPALLPLQSCLKEGENEEARLLHEERLSLQSERNALMASLPSFVISQVEKQKSAVLQALQNCHSQPELDAQIQKIFSPLGGTIETWLNNQFGKIHANGKIPVNVNALSSNAHSTQNKLADALTNKVKNLFKNKDNLKQALLLGRQMKIPGLKGRWEKTLGNWAGKAAIAVQVLTFLHDTHKAHAEQERMNQENRQQSVELYQAAEQVGDAVASSFITSTQSELRR